MNPEPLIHLRLKKDVQIRLSEFRVLFSGSQELFTGSPLAIQLLEWFGAQGVLRVDV